MDIYEISFYNKFKCLMGKCRETCCHGWLIPITEEDLDRFRKTKGLYKLRLLTAISDREIRCFNKGSRTCTFHTKEGLCSLQLRYGHDFIPEACRMFPRFYRNYGPFEEHFLDLSCIGAASLFLNHSRELTLTKTTGSPLSGMCTTNDDTGLLRELTGLRNALIERLNSVTSFDRLEVTIGYMYEQATQLQKAFLNTGYPTRDPSSVISDHKLLSEELDSSKHKWLFPAASNILSDIMSTSFYNIHLKQTNPTLFALCRLYKDTFRHIMQSNDEWNKMWRDFMEKHPDSAHLFAAYMSYYLYLYYLRSYEDYSFIKNATIGIIHLNMLFMFSVLYERKHDSFTADDMSNIIAVYNRRAYFNEETVNEMYSCMLPE